MGRRHSMCHGTPLNTSNSIAHTGLVLTGGAIEEGEGGGGAILEKWR